MMFKTTSVLLASWPSREFSFVGSRAAFGLLLQHSLSVLELCWIIATYGWHLMYSLALCKPQHVQCDAHTLQQRFAAFNQLAVHAAW